jgi:hypothetical protein
LAALRARVEIRDDSYEATASMLEGQEADVLFEKQAKLHPQYADYRQ